MFGIAVHYYRSTILNSNALFAKYALEGVEFRGRVSNRRVTEGGDGGAKQYFIEAMYDISNDNGGHDTFRTKEFKVSPGTYDRIGEGVELIRLPDYPTSALLLETIHQFDKDFSPAQVDSSGFFISVLMMYCALILLLVMWPVECSFCGYLLVPILGVVCFFEFFIGYWIAKILRDRHLRMTLYGAEKMSPTNQDEDVIIPSAIPYKDFVNEEAFSFSYLCCRTLLQVPYGTLSFVFKFLFVIGFGGSFMLFEVTMFRRLKQRALAKYEARNAISTTGIVVALPRNGLYAIITYEVESATYKKKMRGVGGRAVAQFAVSDRPELLYLRTNPASAQLKSYIESRGAGLSCIQKFSFWYGVFYLGVEIALLASLIPGNVEMKLPAGYFALIVTVAILIGGFVGGISYYYFFKDLLHGAIAVTREEANHRWVVEEPVSDIEQEEVLEVGSHDTDDQTEASDEQGNAAIDFFPGGRIPEVDRLQTLLSS
ncbi:hypothetical protein ACHAWF_015174 [Thalassiosira exigua]